MDAALQLRSSLRRYHRRLVGVAFLEDGLLVGAGAVGLLALVLVAGDQGLLRSGAARPTQWMLAWFASLALVALGVRVRASARLDLVTVARSFEERRADLRGRLASAAWLLSGGETAAAVPGYMRAACIRDAARAVATRPGAPPVPKRLARRRAVLFATVVALMAAAHIVAPARIGASWAALGGAPGWIPSSHEAPESVAPRLGGAEILYRFPGYTGRAVLLAHGPGDLEALAGTEALVRFRLLGRAEKARAFTREGSPLTATLTAQGRGLEVVVPLNHDSAYGVVLLSGNGREQSRKLFGIRALADEAPRVRLTEPAKDLLMARPGGLLELAGEAEDDFEVAGVRLRYLATSGSGESYRFAEGSVLPTLTRLEGKVFVEARLDVGLLLGGKDDHGGVLSYHLEAWDSNSRTGPSVGLSETFLVRVPGDDSAPLASGGIVLPPLAERISQRQLLEDTRRLHVRHADMTEKEFRLATQALAEKQHGLLTSFTGLVDEGGIGAAEDHGPEGQVMGTNPNAGSIREIEGVEIHLHTSEALPYAPDVLTALNQALGAMFEAELALRLADTATAMPHMQEAIRFLQEARRYDRLLFRALPVEVTLDPEARGAGDLEGLADLPLPQQPTLERGDLEALVQEIREALQSGKPTRDGQLPAWSHRAFALSGGTEAASLLARAAEASGSREDLLTRAAGLLALLLPVRESVPAVRRTLPEDLADRYFLSLGADPAAEGTP